MNVSRRDHDGDHQAILGEKMRIECVGERHRWSDASLQSVRPSNEIDGRGCQRGVVDAAREWSGRQRVDPSWRLRMESILLLTSLRNAEGSLHC